MVKRAPSLHVECLVYGNSTPEEARAIYQGLVDTLGRECNTKYVLVRVVVVPPLVEVSVVVVEVVIINKSEQRVFLCLGCP